MFNITGLAELRDALRTLPAALVAEAGGIVRAEAEAAAVDVTAAYPVATGNLKGHVAVAYAGTAATATARVKSTAKHAHIFEYGTKAGGRHWATGKSTGRMPAGGVFVPIVIRHRAAMHAQLIALLERAGLTVTGA